MDTKNFVNLPEGEETVMDQPQENPETQMAQDTVKEADPQETQAQEAPKSAENSAPKQVKSEKSSVWKSVLIGGVPGIVLGAAVMGAADSYAGEPIVDDVIEGPDDGNNFEETPDLSHSSVEHATTVTDDMSFSDAFAHARAELGAGGVFTWHGRVFNTYYQEEWADMSQDDKESFMSNVLGAQEESESQDDAQVDGQDVALDTQDAQEDSQDVALDTQDAQVDGQDVALDTQDAQENADIAAEGPSVDVLETENPSEEMLSSEPAPDFHGEVRHLEISVAPDGGVHVLVDTASVDMESPMYAMDPTDTSDSLDDMAAATDDSVRGVEDDPFFDDTPDYTV